MTATMMLMYSMGNFWGGVVGAKENIHWLLRFR